MNQELFVHMEQIFHSPSGRPLRNKSVQSFKKKWSLCHKLEFCTPYFVLPTAEQPNFLDFRYFKLGILLHQIV